MAEVHIYNIGETKAQEKGKERTIDGSTLKSRELLVQS